MNHADLITFSKEFRKRRCSRTSRHRRFFVSSFLLSAAAYLAVTGGHPSLIRAAPAHRSTAQGSQRVESLANVEFRSDIRLFATMAALNAAGFDYESPQKEMSAVRKSLRQELSQLDPFLKARLNAFYLNHRDGQDESREQIVYTSLALVLSGPPDFELVVNSKDLPSDARKVLGFEKLVQEFYRSADIRSVWNRYQPLYRAEMKAYRPILREVIQQSLQYFRIPPRIVLDRQIILMVDLLNAKGIVNARNLERVYYLVVGPSDNPAGNHIQLQHEYLHFVVDPLIEKFQETLFQHEELLKLAQSQPRIKSDRQNRFRLIVGESLIESIVLRLHPPENLESELVRLFREGLIFAPHFYRGLQLYEKSDLLSFPAYCEVLFRGITDSKIREDEKAIEKLEEKIEAGKQEQLAQRQKEQQEKERRNRIRSLLTEAGHLLSQKQYESAQETLDQLLGEDPGNGRALFYLAQAASQQNQHKRAFQYYRQAAQSESTPLWVRAWCLLRMGNFLAFQSRFEEARTHFSQVLAMEGDLRGASEQAQRALGRLPPRKD